MPLDSRILCHHLAAHIYIYMGSQTIEGFVSLPSLVAAAAAVEAGATVCLGESETRAEREKIQPVNSSSSGFSRE